jgi:hypothetical protein
MPFPTPTTVPSWGFSFAVSGMMMPANLPLRDARDKNAIVQRTNIHTILLLRSTSPGPCHVTRSRLDLVATARHSAAQRPPGV